MEQGKRPEFLKDFPPVSTSEWENQILSDLKGADYEKRLVWKTPDGITVRPYYRAEHLESIAHMDFMPGEAPYVRGKNTQGNDWAIRQDFEEENLAKANELARKAIEKGVESVGLNTRTVESAADLQILLKDIDLSAVAVHFLHSTSYPGLMKYLDNYPGSNTIRGSMNFDPLGYFVLYGKPYRDISANMEEAISLLNQAAEKPGFRVITVNGQHYHNAGAGIVQELAFSLSQANEYLAQITDKGLSVDAIAPFMMFRLAVGSSYFLEIAKLRAVKMLWANIVAQYHPTKKESSEMVLHAESSAWNKSIYDPYVNLLRTTTEAMSAAIGGIDSMTLNPFDSTFKKPDDFSLRLARNQQIVLRHEAYFNKVADPAAGSYYVENLTDSIASAAWELFVSLEQSGGFVAAVESGFIQDEIAKTCQRRDMDIAMRKQVFVGANQYPSAGERMLDRLQPTAKLTDLGGLRPYRGPQAFEALRMAVENYEQKGFNTPKVFLLAFGSLAMRKARATFSTNFFGVAGYDIAEGPGYKSATEGIEDARNAGARILVLCSSDEEYAGLPDAVAEMKQTLPGTLIVVAGYPSDCIEQLDKAGVDSYIHLRTNALEALRWFNRELRVEELRC